MGLNKRAIFQQLRTKYAKIGKGEVRLAESNLFFTKDIDPTKSAYKFDVLNTENSTLQPDEIRLNINDEFVATDLGIYLYGTWRNGNNDPGVAVSTQLLSYAPIELDGRALAVKGLYKGKFEFGVNNVTYLENWAIRKHEFVPRTQFASQPVPAAGPPVIGNSYPATIPSLDYYKAGMCDLASVLTLSGAKKNGLIISLVDAITPTIVTYRDQLGTLNYVNITKVALKLDGFLAQNAAKFQGSDQA